MNNKNAAFYNQFSFLYPIVDAFLRPQKKRLFNQVNNLPHGNLLEIGVGNGSHLKYYKKHNITGIDTSATMLARACENNNEHITLMLMNGETLSFTGEMFDYVVLSHVIAVVDDPEKLLQEAHRVMKPKGQLLILNHFTPDNYIRYFDYALQPLAKLFRFRSVFRVRDIKALTKFSLLQETGMGPASYFKLLIYQK